MTALRQRMIEGRRPRSRRNTWRASGRRCLSAGASATGRRILPNGGARHPLRRALSQVDRRPGRAPSFAKASTQRDADRARELEIEPEHERAREPRALSIPELEARARASARAQAPTCSWLEAHAHAQSSVRPPIATPPWQDASQLHPAPTGTRSSPRQTPPGCTQQESGSGRPAPPCG